MSHTLAFIGPFGPWELILLAVLGLLIFGKRLPEVGKSIGKGIVEFKKGLSGIEEDVSNAGTDIATPTPDANDLGPSPDPAKLDAPTNTTAVDTEQPARTQAPADRNATGNG